jgi:hypothetical protein
MVIEVALPCTNSYKLFLVTVFTACSRFRGSSCETTCFDQSGHHHVPSHEIYVQKSLHLCHKIFRDILNIIICVKIVKNVASMVKKYVKYKMFKLYHYCH